MLLAVVGEDTNVPPVVGVLTDHHACSKPSDGTKTVIAVVGEDTDHGAEDTDHAAEKRNLFTLRHLFSTYPLQPTIYHFPTSRILQP